MTLKRMLVRIGNRIAVWMYRAFDGRLASYNKGATVLMITIPGRRTGVLHSTCVRYLDTADGFLVWGTASGAPRDPDWFRNLREAKTADVQIRAKTLQVRPRERLARSARQYGRTLYWLGHPRCRNTRNVLAARFRWHSCSPSRGRLGEAPQLTTAEP